MQNETNELRVIQQRVEWKTTHEMSGGKLAKTAAPVFYRTLEQKKNTQLPAETKTRGRLTQTGERLTVMAQEYSALATWRDDPTPGSAGVVLKSAMMSWSVAGVRPQLLFPFVYCVYRVYSFSSSSSLNPPKFSHISFGSAHGKGPAPH